MAREGFSVVLCYVFVALFLMPCSASAEDKYQFNPEPGAKGQEYVYQMDPMPKGMHTASFRLWIPDSICKTSKIRGVIAVSGRTQYKYFRQTEIFRSGHWRALASELQLAIFVHSTSEYCSHDHVACSAAIGQPTIESICGGLDYFARTTGHPELKYSGLIFTGRSATGRQALFIGNTMPQRTIAMVLYSPASSLPNPLTTTGVPVLINMAGLDLKHANPIVLDKKLVLAARAQGAPWAGLYQAKVVHGGYGEPSFVMDWIRAIAQLRIPEQIPTDAPVQLRAINLRDGWLGKLKLNSDLNNPQPDGPEAASICSYTDGRDPATAYWLPNVTLAQAWKQYCVRKDASFRHGWSLFEDSFVNSIGMRMMPLPAGRFTMGSPLDEEKRADDEVQYQAHLLSPFYLGTTEVTQAQWQRVMGSNPSKFKADNNPVEQISYHDALRFCQKLSELDGRKYRLPTEAEWEYACRARTTTPFHHGWTIDPELANYCAEVGYCGGLAGTSRRQPQAVAQFIPNDWGLFDMHGNVSEWCSDWYSPYNTKTQGTDPKGPAEGTERVFRGGSFDDLPKGIRSACRGRLSPPSTSPTIGLRVVCDSTSKGLLLLPDGWALTGGW